MICVAISQGKNSANRNDNLFADADVVGAGEEVSDLLPRVLGIVRSLIAFARFGSLRAIACMCMPSKWEMNNELDVIRTPVRSRVTGDDGGHETCAVQHQHEA
jgi:hypothetical protein